MSPLRFPVPAFPVTFWVPLIKILELLEFTIPAWTAVVFWGIVVPSKKPVAVPICGASDGFTKYQMRFESTMLSKINGYPDEFEKLATASIVMGCVKLIDAFDPRCRPFIRALFENEG